MGRKWQFLAVLAVLAGAGTLSFHRKHSVAVRASARSPEPTVKGPEVTLSGKLRPQHVVPLSPEVDGDIDALLANVGDEVYQGEVLARIGSAGLESVRDAASAAAGAAEAQVLREETAVASARVEAARAEAEQQRSRAALDKAHSVWERQQTLHNAGATPRLTWESAQRDYEAAQKDYAVVDQAARLTAGQVQSALNALAAANKDLADRQQQVADAAGSLESAELRSPVAGLVVARNGEPGKPAAAEIFDIATDLVAWEVALDADPQVLRGRLQPGQPALVLIPDLQNAGISGEIKEVQATQVVVQFNAALPAIRPGMWADVRLKLQ